MIIESTQNEKIKYITRLLADNRFRKKEEVFVVEGKQENERASKYGFEAQEYYISDSIFNHELPKGTVHLISAKIYDKIAYRGSSEGIIGIYKTVNSELQNFKASENSTVIVVEGVEKPGNLGAILRSCEAFGIDAVIVTDAKVDFFNPNVIRSSVGCLFGMNLFSCKSSEAYSYLTKNGFQLYTTIMDTESKNIQDRNLKTKSAVIFGTEHSGLTEFWLGKGENTVIPMSGTIDSLNLSNAVAICCYEVSRQKLL